MKEVRYFYVPDAAEKTELPQDEAIHALRVLRLKEDDEIFLMDGAGVFFHSQVTQANAKHCCYKILSVMPQEPTWHGRIHLAIAPTKNIDRMEWLAEKATEVGFDELSFLDCQFSERRQLRQDRIEKIVVAAMKQSRKAWLPKVNDMVSFREFVLSPRQGRLFIAHCYDPSSFGDDPRFERKDLFSELTLPDTLHDDVTILVGPEGDFSIGEVQQAVESGFIPVSLGQSRLRTETAGLAAVMMSQLAKAVKAPR